MRIEGLNHGDSKYSPDTAPYFFEQVVDRLEDGEFNKFYQLIAAECNDIMSVNLYVTGLIMYYAGQLTYKLRMELNRAEVPPAIKQPPIIKIVFAGKGARIFDWFPAINEKASSEYFNEMFLRGLGGMDVAKELIRPFDFANGKIVSLNEGKADFNNEVKYEVSKGLAYPTGSLQVPKERQAIEILGEEGFKVYRPNGEMVDLDWGTSITAEMMANLGGAVVLQPGADQPPCPRFMDFADLFYKVATSMFGLEMSQQDFMNGFQSMNIESFVRNSPEYIEAKKNAGEAEFDFVAPIIILEGMKFYEDILLKSLAN